MLGSRLGKDPALMSVIFLTLTISKGTPVHIFDQATTTSMLIIIYKPFLLSILLPRDSVSSCVLNVVKEIK